MQDQELPLVGGSMPLASIIVAAPTASMPLPSTSTSASPSPSTAASASTGGTPTAALAVGRHRNRGAAARENDGRVTGDSVCPSNIKQS